jgi:hypothetical protein
VRREGFQPARRAALREPWGGQSWPQPAFSRQDSLESEPAA